MLLYARLDAYWRRFHRFVARRMFAADRTCSVPNEHDLCFYVETFEDSHLLPEALDSLRGCYEQAKIFVVSDGDGDPKIKEIALRRDACFISGERTKLLSHGGIFLRRMLRHFLTTEAVYLLKIDPDTRVHRRFNWLPQGRCIFGTIQRNGFQFSVQGGFTGISRSAASDLLALPNSVWDSLVDYRATWASRIPSVLKHVERTGRISTDWMIAYMAHEANVPLVEYSEVWSTWQPSTPPSCTSFAATHPHKVCTKNSSTERAL